VAISSKNFNLKPRRGFRKTRARSKSWETFLEKSFPNPSKNFNLKPRRGFRKTRARSKPWETFLDRKSVV
jgi:hypothetical protein